MEVFVVLFGCAAKPELTDELKGFSSSKNEADSYCRVMNRVAPDGWAYWVETVPNIAVAE